jgi:putative membrane protein
MRNTMIPSNVKTAAVIVAGIALCGASAAMAQGNGQGDRNFVVRAAGISNAAVLNAGLAQQKSSSREVKAFAQQVLGEHTQLTQALAPLADKVSVTLTPGEMSARQQAAAAKLETLAGAAFDQEFLRVQIAELVYGLRIYQSEIATTRDPGLKQTAEAGARAISAELRIAGQLAQARQTPLSARNPAAVRSADAASAH